MLLNISFHVLYKRINGFMVALYGDELNMCIHIEVWCASKVSADNGVWNKHNKIYLAWKLPSCANRTETYQPPVPTAFCIPISRSSQETFLNIPHLCFPCGPLTHLEQIQSKGVYACAHPTNLNSMYVRPSRVCSVVRVKTNKWRTLIKPAVIARAGFGSCRKNYMHLV